MEYGVGRMSDRGAARREGRLAFALTVAAAGWSLALVPAAFLAPMYSGAESSTFSGTTHTTATLVGVNGLWVIAPVSVPLVVALLAWAGLRMRCSSGSRAGTLLAWAAIGVLALFAVVAGLSIGPYFLPAVLLLGAGAWATPLGERTPR